MKDLITRQDVLDRIVRFSTEKGSNVECQKLYCDIHNMPSFDHITKEQIVKLAVENNVVAEVYDTLHYILMAELSSLHDKSVKMHSELRLVKKFADLDKLDVIKDILAGSEEEE